MPEDNDTPLLRRSGLNWPRERSEMARHLFNQLRKATLTNGQRLTNAQMVEICAQLQALIGTPEDVNQEINHASER